MYPTALLHIYKNLKLTSSFISLLVFNFMSLEGDIAAVYEDVRNDKTPTQWLLLGYSDDKSDKISLKAKGVMISRPIKTFLC